MKLRHLVVLFFSMLIVLVIATVSGGTNGVQKGEPDLSATNEAKPAMAPSPDS